MSEKKIHIAIITGQHMVANPRVWKEANTLAKNGYKVSILTTFYSALKLEQDAELLHPSIHYKALVNLIPNQGSITDVYISRVVRKLAILSKKIFHWDNNYLLAYRPAKQVKLAELEAADLYIGHQEVGLIVGNALILKGKKVAFDFEDWYSKDYINVLRPVRLLEKAESFALSNGVFSTCPSQAMADALQKSYNDSIKIHVLYNGFSMTESEVVVSSNQYQNALVWFSQTIGPGRGLETLMQALQFVNQPVEVHLAGACSNAYQQALQNLLQYTHHRLVFHKLMPHKKLIHFLSAYPVALSIENKHPDNKDKTVSNKMFQYLQSGNAVLATNTMGHLEIAAKMPDAISIVDVNQPVQWAKAIEELLNHSKQNKQDQSSFFKKNYSWEAQEEQLLKLVKESFE